MSKFSKVLVTLLTTLALNAAASTAGEIATAEALLGFRVTRNIVWIDPLTNEPLHRRLNSGDFVKAAKDDDVHANLDNAGSIMGGYLLNPQSVPAATIRVAAITELVGNANWRRLFVTLEKSRRLVNNTLRDCFGAEIVRLRLGAADPVGNTRDIVDTPTLLNAIAPSVVSGQALIRAPLPVLTAGERATAEALLGFRRTKNFFWLDPRTGQSLYRVVGEEQTQAAKDDDVHVNLDNAGTIMSGYLNDAKTIPAASAIPAALTAIFADANWNRLYTLVETARRGENRFMFDCLGNPLYKLSLGARAQAVDMREIVDIPTLINAVELYFPQSCRQNIVPVPAVNQSPAILPFAEGSVLESVLGEVVEKKEEEKEGEKR